VVLVYAFGGVIAAKPNGEMSPPDSRGAATESFAATRLNSSLNLLHALIKLKPDSG
jgi:hypothetical protein